MFTRLILFLLSILHVGVLYSQDKHPVAINTHFIPPYSLYLDDYTSDYKERFGVILLNRDIHYPNMEVKLRLQIKAGGLQLVSHPYGRYEPIFLDAGIQYRVTGNELTQYFQAQNLQVSGMGANSFNRNRKLPTGMVEFTIEVLEYHSGKVVSPPGKALAWISTHRPPLLNQPQNNQEIPFREPLNVLFQWTPLHSGIANVKYELIIKQLWDNGLRPEAAWLYSPEIYREEIVPTSLLYGAAMPPLLAGMRYAWAVRAYMEDGGEEIRVFENNGLSEVHTFIVEDYCPPPYNIKAVTDRGKIKLTWTPLPEHHSFNVFYRGQGWQEWFESPSQEGAITLYDVRQGSGYEYRIGSVCASGKMVYSPISSINIPQATPNENCGIQGFIDLSNKEPLPSLSSGEMFMASDFPVYVSEVEGSKGVFTGKGYTILPSMFAKAKLAVTFDGIRLNTDRRLVGGSVKGVYDASQSQIVNIDEILEGGDKVGKIQKGITKAAVDVNFTIPDNSTLSLKDDILIIEDAQGKEVGSFTIPKDTKNEGTSIFPVTIKDKDGNIYTIDAPVDPETGLADTGNLQINKAGKEGKPLPEGSVNFDKFDNKLAWVNFLPSGNYALDRWSKDYLLNDLLNKNYQSTDIGIAYKLIPAGRSDRVDFRVELKDKKIDPSKIIYTTEKGTEFTAQVNKDGVYSLLLPAAEVQDGYAVYALYPKGNKYYNFGKLVVVSYPEKTVKLKIVPVNGDADKLRTKQASLTKELNAIFNPVGISLNLEVLPSFHYEGNLGFMEKGSGLLSAYTPAMRELQAAYGEVEQDAAYLFYIQGGNGANRMDRDAAAFMPRNKQFAYVFSDNYPDLSLAAPVIAHELGHGLLSLHHTFDYKIPLRTTGNLMDYKGGTELAKWQWDRIYDPGVVIGLFQKDKDAFGPNTFLSSAAYKTEVQEGIFLTPAGYPIWVENLDQVRVLDKSTAGSLPAYSPFNLGVLLGFRLKNGDNYFWEGSGIEYFKGYAKSESKPTEYYSNSGTLAKINSKDEAGNFNTNFKIWDLEAGHFVDYLYASKLKKELPKGWTKYGEGPVSKEIYPEYTTHLGKIKSKDELIEKSARERSENWTKDVDLFAQLVKELQDKNSFVYLGKSLQLVQTADLLNDKFIAYNRITNKNVYVVRAKVDYAIPSDSVFLFARDVFQKAGLDANNTILITIPYTQRYMVYTSDPSKGSQSSLQDFRSPGAHGKNLPLDLEDKEDISTLVSDFYAQIPKPLHVYTYIVRADGHIEFVLAKSEEDKLGYNCVNQIRYFIDKEITVTADFYKFRSTRRAPFEGSQHRPSPAEAKEAERLYNRMMELWESDRSFNDYLRQEVNLRESYIPSNHRAWVVNDFLNQYSAFKTSMNIEIPPKVEKSMLIDPGSGDVFLNVSDLLSIPLSFIGADFFTDISGAIYCYVQGDYLMMSLYSGAIIIPGGSGAGLARLEKHIAEQAGKRLTKKTPQEILEASFPNVDKADIAALMKQGSKAELSKFIHIELNLSELEAKEFIVALSQSETLAQKFGKNPEELIGAYRLLLGRFNKSFSAKQLEKFSLLSKEVQEHMVLYSNKSLPTFLEDVAGNRQLLDFVNNPDNLDIMGGVVAHKMKEPQARIYSENLAEFLTTDLEQLPALERNFVENLVQHSENVKNLLRLTNLGRSLSDKIVANMRQGIQGGNSHLLQELSRQTGIPLEELRKYDLLVEVPLITSGGYMKADVVLIKKNIEKKKFDDVIVIENKLSQGTELTTRQKEGFGAILNGQIEMKVKYNMKGNIINLTNKDAIPVSKDKIFRFYDGGTDNINNVTIQKIINKDL